MRREFFPHCPEPVPENLTSLKAAILRENADLGIVVDPDADRLVLIMENGEPFLKKIQSFSQRNMF